MKINLIKSELKRVYRPFVQPLRKTNINLSKGMK